MNEFTIPDCPPVLGLPPIAVASPDVESLCSYGMRLARHNGISPSRLFADPGLKFRQPGVGFPHAFPVIAKRNGYAGITMSRDGRIIADLIAERTGIKEAEALAWFSDENAISLARMTASFVRWCPVCLVSDPYPYFRLAWELMGVNACHHHALKLQDRCCGCGKQIAAFRPRAGYCTFCGMDLAAAPYRHIAAPKQDIAAAREFSRLIATISADRRLLETCRPAEALIKWAVANGASSIGRQAALFGISKSTVSAWNHGGAISLSSLISVGMPLGLSPTEALLGKIITRTKTPVPIRSPWGNRRKVQEDPVGLVEKLDALARSPFFPSLREVATSMTLDRHCLRRANQAACAAIANRSETLRRTLTKSQWLLFTAVIELRCATLLRRHEVISARTLTADFHKHRIFLRGGHQKYVRQKLRALRSAQKGLPCERVG